MVTAVSVCVREILQIPDPFTISEWPCVDLFVSRQEQTGFSFTRLNRPDRTRSDRFDYFMRLLGGSRSSRSWCGRYCSGSTGLLNTMEDISHPRPPLNQLFQVLKNPYVWIDAYMSNEAHKGAKDSLEEEGV